jgi:O-acetylserine/cysteine efflux transporter
LLGVTLIWGSNFVVIRLGLQGFDPLLLATLRFCFAAFPLVLWLPRPAISVPWLALNGAMIGAGQFGLLFLAMQGHISPGLASLIMQTQVFFTILLAALCFGQHIRPQAMAGLGLGAIGLATVGAHLDATLTPLGLAMVLAAAAFWACSNLLTQHLAKRAAVPLDMLAFIVWSSLFAIGPLLALSLLTEGPARIAQQLAEAQSSHWAAAVWQAVGNTLIGYVLWSALLARYTVAAVTPWALLVPVFGMGTAAVLLGEPLPPWKLLAGALVVAGLAVASGAGSGLWRRAGRTGPT